MARHGELNDGSITLLANIGSQQMRLFDYVAARDTLEQALPLANAAAALTCTRPGAQASLPDRAAVDRYLRERS